VTLIVTALIALGVAALSSPLSFWKQRLHFYNLADLELA
jgi:CHASE1-domain containing sensor protein